MDHGAWGCGATGGGQFGVWAEKAGGYGTGWAPIFSYPAADEGESGVGSDAAGVCAEGNYHAGDGVYLDPGESADRGVWEARGATGEPVSSACGAKFRGVDAEAAGYARVCEGRGCGGESGDPGQYQPSRV